MTDIRKRKAICYGDSNTFGYDPRSFFGDRYPEEAIWVGILAADPALKRQWEMLNRGRNGRELPHTLVEYRYLEQLLEGLDSRDLLVIMLGSNDIFMTMDPDADKPIGRMDRLLRWLTKERATEKNPAENEAATDENAAAQGSTQILVIAPPYPDAAEYRGTSEEALFDRYTKESARMNEGFRRLAASYHVEFADASAWGIEAAFDRVHFTEEGHRQFAAQMKQILEQIC